MNTTTDRMHQYKERKKLYEIWKGKNKFYFEGSIISG